MSWAVELRQSKQMIPQLNGEAQLAKAPFQFIFTMQNLATIINNTWITDKNYRLINPGLSTDYQPSDGLIHCMLSGRETAEYPFNKEETIFVNPDDHNLWYYKNHSDHRWSKAYSRDNLIYLERNVSSLFVRESNVNVSIDKFTNDRLYMIFIRKIRNDTKIHEEELKKIVLNFC